MCANLSTLSESFHLSDFVIRTVKRKCFQFIQTILGSMHTYRGLYFVIAARVKYFPVPKISLIIKQTRMFDKQIMTIAIQFVKLLLFLNGAIFFLLINRNYITNIYNLCFLTFYFIKIIIQ